MTYLSARRMLSACAVSVASVAALAAPGTASATTDLTHQCAGSNIKGLGSTFQAAAQEPVWNKDFDLSTDTNVLACAGNTGQGSLETREVKYESTGTAAGSGACLKDFGDGEAPKYGVRTGEGYPYCGTDEAPSSSALSLMEADREGGEAESIESLPVLQGAEAVIVHLPTGCKAQAKVKATTTGVAAELGRLALDDLTVLKIYRGEIKDWGEVLAAQGAGHGEDKLACKYGVFHETEAEQKEATEEGEAETINVVVRTDKSGTTHIFKSFLAEVEERAAKAGEITEGFTAETFPENITEENAPKKNACGAELAEATKTYKEMQEGCENQRWAKEAHIIRPIFRPGSKVQKIGYKGNPGVVYEVNFTPSSISYADLAVAREENAFSANCTGAKEHPASECGGENKKGTETKVGEQNVKFWAVLQNSKTAGETYTDPGAGGDIEAAGQSNCAATEYIGKVGETIPPVSTRVPWNTVKAALVEKDYGLCGLTYDLALRVYKPYLKHIAGGAMTTEEEEKGKAEAQTTRDYLLWEVNALTDGGGAYIKNHDYEKLPTTIQKRAETGIKEIGWETP